MKRYIVTALLISIPLARGVAAQEHSPYAHTGSGLVKTLS